MAPPGGAGKKHVQYMHVFVMALPHLSTKNIEIEVTLSYILLM